MNPISSLPLALPGRALRLYARFWLPLVVWYLLGRGLHDGLLEVAAHVNRHNAVIAFSIVATAILCSLVAYVFMFQTVQPGLPTVFSLRRQEAAVDPTVNSPERRSAREQLRAVGLALLPFLLVYSAWELFEDDVRAVSYRTWEINPLEGTPSRAEFTLWFAAAAVVAWVLVKVLEGITRRTRNPVTALLAAIFEANWMFFAIYGVSELLKASLAWLQNTLAWANLSDLWHFTDGVGPVLPIRFYDVLAGLDFGWLGILRDPFTNGIILPIAWLAIAGACYGREMEDVHGLVDRRRFAQVAQRLEKAPNVLQRHARRFPPEGVREKYYPPLHAIRLMLTASVPALLLFCVLYSALDLANPLLTQTITTIIGPHPAGTFWQEVQPIVGVAVDTVTEPLRICLLAVTFDLALSMFTSARANAAGGGTSGPVPARAGVPQR